jgi:hypothetical protein
MRSDFLNGLLLLDRVGGELLFRPFFLRIPRLATILRCAILSSFSSTFIEAPDLDDGNPRELGGQCADLLSQHPQINVLGGCCGTDHHHIEEIARACKVAS